MIFTFTAWQTAAILAIGMIGAYIMGYRDALIRTNKRLADFEKRINVMIQKVEKK